MLAVDKAPEGFIRLLAPSTDPQLLEEVAWVVCCATFSPSNLNRLVHLGLIAPIMPQVQNCLQQVRTPRHACLLH